MKENATSQEKEAKVREKRNWQKKEKFEKINEEKKGWTELLYILSQNWLKVWGKLWRLNKNGYFPTQEFALKNNFLIKEIKQKLLTGWQKHVAQGNFGEDVSLNFDHQTLHKRWET